MENAKKRPFELDEVQISQSALSVYKKVENFMKSKQEECNDRNTRLYCSPVSSNNYYDSARTCVTIATKRQKGSECYVKKTKAENITGPLCNGGLDPASENSYKISLGLTFDGPRPDVQERISNLEQCLNLPDDTHDKTDFHKKLKFIEDHVLRLESIILKIKGVDSLSDLCSIDLQTYLSDPDKTSQEKVICDVCKHEVESRNRNFTVPQPIQKESKYTADNIQMLIKDIKRSEGATSSLLNKSNLF